MACPPVFSECGPDEIITFPAVLVAALYTCRCFVARFRGLCLNVLVPLFFVWFISVFSFANTRALRLWRAYASLWGHADVYAYMRPQSWDFMECALCIYVSHVELQPPVAAIDLI